MSEYGRQLSMKQKIKGIYGILERQFRKHYQEVKGKEGITGDLLLARLEKRLDNVVYRLGFAKTRRQARQLVSHGFVLVSGKKVTIPSFEVAIGDIITVNPHKKEKKYFQELLPVLKKKKDFPSWLVFDGEKMEGKVVAEPSRDDVEHNVDPQLVVEFYSK